MPLEQRAFMGGGMAARLAARYCKDCDWYLDWNQPGDVDEDGCNPRCWKHRGGACSWGTCDDWKVSQFLAGAAGLTRDWKAAGGGADA